jgi:hypothetical protein
VCGDGTNFQRHNVIFKNIRAVAEKTGYIDGIVKEAFETQLHSDILIETYSLSHPWNPFTNKLKQSMAIKQ